jgi:hypothetical protein
MSVKSLIFGMTTVTALEESFTTCFAKSCLTILDYASRTQKLEGKS